jgi:hypothetical protein
MPPAGWYADPLGPGRRYWNGQAWTADMLPDAPVAPPQPVVAPALIAPTQSPRLASGFPSTPMGPTSLNQSLVLSLIGVALVFVSGFLTWATGYVYGQKTGSENGWSGRAPWAVGGPDSLEIAQWLAYGPPASGTSDFLLILAIAVAGGVTAWFAMRGGSHRLVQATVALGVLCAVLVFTEIGAFHSAGSDVGDLLGADVDVKAGLGAYVCLFGSALIAGGAVRHALQQHKSAVS